MKKYKLGITMGILSIISSLLFAGIPVGRENLQIAYFILFLLLNFTILVFGLFAKKDKTVIIISIISVVLILLSTLYIENNPDVLTNMVVLGWLVSLSLGTVGLYRTINNRGNYVIRIAMVLCLTGIALSIASLVMGLVTNGGFVIPLS